MVCALVLILLLCFFFKQKTAYEMRISDWSSDVCSSDLPTGEFHRAGAGIPVRRNVLGYCAAGVRTHKRGIGLVAGNAGQQRPFYSGGAVRGQRSEEHTSELQSLMRISYADFRLKKKITHNILKSHSYQPTNDQHSVKHIRGYT